MRKLLLVWLRKGVSAISARLGERARESWRKRAKENFYDPLHELQMFGDLLEPRPESPPTEHPGKGQKAREPPSAFCHPKRTSQQEDHPCLDS